MAHRPVQALESWIANGGIPVNVKVSASVCTASTVVPYPCAFTGLKSGDSCLWRISSHLLSTVWMTCSMRLSMCSELACSSDVKLRGAFHISTQLVLSPPPLEAYGLYQGPSSSKVQSTRKSILAAGAVPPLPGEQQW